MRRAHADWQRALRNRASLEHLAGLESIERLAAGAGRAAVGDGACWARLNILVPMAGLIDVAAEIERLTKRLAKADAGPGQDPRETGQ